MKTEIVNDINVDSIVNLQLRRIFSVNISINLRITVILHIKMAYYDQ